VSFKYAVEDHRGKQDLRAAADCGQTQRPNGCNPTDGIFSFTVGLISVDYERLTTVMDPKSWTITGRLSVFIFML
jgi:hypothetical protein